MTQYALDWIRKNLNGASSIPAVIIRAKRGSEGIAEPLGTLPIPSAAACLRGWKPGLPQAWLRIAARKLYRRSQDDSQLQPLRFYVPLLAHNSGLGGLASSERSATTIWNLQLIRNPCEPRPKLSRLLYCVAALCGGKKRWA
jgi:hypothetical protein